jgi:hypothetical protein
LTTTSRRLTTLALVLLGSTLATGACHDPAGPELDQPFQIGVGRTVAVDAVTLHFLDVSQDSRCPRGADCIWAGDAVVRLRALLGSDSAGVELHANAAAGPAQVAYHGYGLELMSLTPDPVVGQPIAPDKYTATLRVTKP